MRDKLKTSTWTWKPNISSSCSRTRRPSALQNCDICKTVIFLRQELSAQAAASFTTLTASHLIYSRVNAYLKNRYVLLFCSSWTSRAPAWLFRINHIWQTCFVGLQFFIIRHFIHVLASCDLALLLFLITFRSSVQPSGWSSQKSVPSFLCAHEARVQMWPDRGEYKARQESQGDQPRSAALEQQHS